MLEIDSTSLFELLIARPGTNRPLVVFDMNVGESGFFKRFPHRPHDPQWPTCFFSRQIQTGAPAEQDVIFWDGIIVALDNGA